MVLVWAGAYWMAPGVVGEIGLVEEFPSQTVVAAEVVAAEMVAVVVVVAAAESELGVEFDRWRWWSRRRCSPETCAGRG